MIFKILRNRIFFTLQTSKIRVLLEKNNNIEGNKGDNNNSGKIIQRSDGASNRNLNLRSDFLTFRTMIAFVQLRKVFTEALIL